MNPINIAFIGCGRHMFNFLYPRLRKLPVNTAGVCDKDPAKLKHFASYYAVSKLYTDYEEMILETKPDAVVCAVEADVHYRAAKYCLSRQIPVYVEKAPCETAAQAEELAELSLKNNRIAMVGFNRRYATGYMMARDAIGRKEFGQPALFYMKFHASPYRSVDYYVFNHIIHLLDTACYMLGKLDNISVLHRVFTPQKGSYIVNFTAASGAIGTVQSACMLATPYPMEYLDIAGTGGQEVTVDNLQDVRYNRTGPKRDEIHGLALQDDGDCLSWNASNGHSWGVDYLGFDAQLDEFYNAVAGGKKIISGIESCVDTMIALERVMELTGSPAKRT
jgi:predicted dehydrogenase